MSDSSPRDSSSLHTALWLAAGAAAGAAIGVFIAQRGGARKLMTRVRGLVGMAEQWTSADEDDGDEEPELDEYGAEVDDDDDDQSSGEPGIDARVLAAFEQDPILSERGIEIDVDEADVIVLSGRVPSEKDAAHAETIAGGVPGVHGVENRIRVRGRRGTSTTTRR